MRQKISSNKKKRGLFSNRLIVVANTFLSQRDGVVLVFREHMWTLERGPLFRSVQCASIGAVLI